MAIPFASRIRFLTAATIMLMLLGVGTVLRGFSALPSNAPFNGWQSDRGASADVTGRVRSLGVTSGHPIDVFTFMAGTGQTPQGMQKLAALSAAAAAPTYGISWRFKWSDLETGDGTYTWDLVDSAIASTKSVNKKVMLRVISGIYSPVWVDAISRTLTFSSSLTPNPSIYPPTLTMPVPWDPTYLAKWTAFIAAFGRRYSGDTSIFSFQVAGGGMIGDMYLPRTTAWKASGYTDTKLMSSYETILSAYVQAFPSQRLNLDIVEPLASGSNVMGPLVSYCATAYGSGVFIQQNGLKASYAAEVGPYRKLIEHAATTGSAGYQVSNAFTSSSGSVTGTPDTTLGVAIQDHVTYVEVYYQDIVNPALTTSITRLAAGW